jgi:HAD superfamily hydrolase (TIGR01549 family)
MGIILDLDQTLVNSSIAAALRKGRKWSEVYDLIPKFEVYDGLQELFEFTDKNKIKVAIVTTSPSGYCKKVVTHFGFPITDIVGYHDASPIKPHAAPMLKALELMKLKPGQVISVGDRAIDIESSKNAGIVSVGCLWGSEEKELLKNSNPDYLIDTPAEIITVAKKHFGI